MPRADRSASAVFTVAHGAPFLPTLAEALLAGRLVGPVGGDPLALAGVTLYLPTRRAADGLAAALADRLGPAALLPRLIALGEADGADLDLAADTLPGEADAAPAAVPMPPLERRLILARLVQAWARGVDRSLLPIDAEVPFRVSAAPADAVALAGDLERLMDALTVEGLPWSEIGAAVEAEYSRYFGLTLDFVRIAAENWPRILVERGLADPVSRARGLLLAEADRLLRTPPADPVIVAGATGSSPATARLIAAVARLPRGAVVLPGLDLDLDAAGWDAIEAGEGSSRRLAHGHPQAVLHRLLGPGGLGLERGRVVALGAVDARAAARAALLSQALRPADTTDAWSALPPGWADTARRGLDELALAEAADEREEALVAAVALREALERPGATAALITPDRGLAARVAVELLRWGIVAGDAAGQTLSASPAGRLARLTADLADDLAHRRAASFPARLIALLSHPMVRLGLTRSEAVRGAAALEIGLLRGLAPEPDLGALRATLDLRRAAPPEHRPRAERRLKPIDWDLAGALLDRLTVAFAGFPGDAEPGASGDLVGFAAGHRAACDWLLSGPDGAPGPDDPSLACLDALFDDLDAAGPGAMPGGFDEYGPFFAGLARERTVALPEAVAHPRVRLLGLIEARLTAFDRVVLGGLDEGVWPVRTLTDAFLNRPMRERVGLTPPERRVGQMAHDFVEALGCRDAVLTRAHKRGGAPTVPSRLIQRVRALAGEAAWAGVRASGRRLSDLAARLDAAPARARLTRPAPRPDPALFPRTLSVTEIETLVRDPYSVFARHVLGLDPLEPVAGQPGAAARGSLVHAIFGAFAQAHPGALPERADERLFQIALNAFGAIADAYPDLYAEWWPRYGRTALAYLPWEADRRPGLTRVHAEVSGRWPIAVGTETFTLRARADRIEWRADGGACIVDFKTGAPPPHREIFAGFAPQLPLEAAMLMAGAFDGLPAARGTPDLLHVHASGGRRAFAPVPVRPPRGDPRTVEGLVAEHARELVALVGRFLRGEAAYASRPHPRQTRGPGAYDHLARVREWSLAGEAEEAE